MTEDGKMGTQLDGNVQWTEKKPWNGVPFDPRTDISADARHISGRIVQHMWIIFVLLPVVLGILFVILTAK
jgi:hypothetical protein